MDREVWVIEENMGTMGWLPRSDMSLRRSELDNLIERIPTPIIRAEYRVTKYIPEPGKGEGGRDGSK